MLQGRCQCRRRHHRRRHGRRARHRRADRHGGDADDTGDPTTPTAAAAALTMLSPPDAGGVVEAAAAALSGIRTAPIKRRCRLGHRLGDAESVATLHSSAHGAGDGANRPTVLGLLLMISAPSTHPTASIAHTGLPSEDRITAQCSTALHRCARWMASTQRVPVAAEERP